MENANKISYPYLPENRSFLFVGMDDPFMRAARVVCEKRAACSWWPIGVVLVKDGQVLAEGYNGEIFNPHCPRVKENCPTGKGYELCADVCGQTEHGERKALSEARKKGIDPSGADIYLFGHWWCCEPCWKAMIDAGVHNVCLLTNAHLIFSREKRLEKQSLVAKKLANSETITREEMFWVL